MKPEGKNSILTPSEITHIIIAMMIGVGILGGTGTIKEAGNDGWIAILIAGIYPLYMVFLASIISKRFPKDNLIEINKKLFGKYLGFVLSMYLCFVFIYVIVVVLSGFTFITRTIIANFIPESVIVILSMVLISYFATKGLKVIAKVNVIIFYLTILFIVLPGYALLKGSYLNLLPVFNGGLSHVLKGSIESIYSYAGIEVVFLLYPFASDKKKLLPAMLKGVFAVIAIYVWLTVIMIFYLGPDVAIKFYWPLLSIADSVQIPIINLFRSMFMLLWSLIIYRISANMLFFSSLIIKDFLQIKKDSEQNIIIAIIAIISSFLIFIIENESFKKEITKIEPYIALVFAIYITIVTLLVVLLKKKELKNKNSITKSVNEQG